jgi:hypothetical protein
MREHGGRLALEMLIEAMPEVGRQSCCRSHVKDFQATSVAGIPALRDRPCAHGHFELGWFLRKSLNSFGPLTSRRFLRSRSAAVAEGSAIWSI